MEKEKNRDILFGGEVGKRGTEKSVHTGRSRPGSLREFIINHRCGARLMKMCVKWQHRHALFTCVCARCTVLVSLE